MKLPFPRGHRPLDAPDPHSLLRRAHEDFLAKRYDDALAKYLWFHRHAVTVQPAMCGVRLSFALSAWHRLAQLHPPAMVALEETREEAIARVRRGEDLEESFGDAAAINRERGKSRVTVELFEELHRRDPEEAKRIYREAEPALLKAEAFELCGRYIDPSRDFERAIRTFGYIKNRTGSHNMSSSLAETLERHFIHSTATLVAILARNGRLAEAKWVADQAGAEWDDPTLRARLEEALAGVVPPL